MDAEEQDVEPNNAYQGTDLDEDEPTQTSNATEPQNSAFDPTHSHATSRLLKLPLELREMIIEEVLRSPVAKPYPTEPASCPLGEEFWSLLSLRSEPEIHIQPLPKPLSHGLLLTNRQLHQETQATIQRLKKKKEFPFSMCISFHHHETVVVEWTSIPFLFKNLDELPSLDITLYKFSCAGSWANAQMSMKMTSISLQIMRFLADLLPKTDPHRLVRHGVYGPIPVPDRNHDSTSVPPSMPLKLCFDFIIPGDDEQADELLASASSDTMAQSRAMYVVNAILPLVPVSMIPPKAPLAQENAKCYWKVERELNIFVGGKYGGTAKAFYMVWPIVRSNTASSDGGE